MIFMTSVTGSVIASGPMTDVTDSSDDASRCADLRMTDDDGFSRVGCRFKPMTDDGLSSGYRYTRAHKSSYGRPVICVMAEELIMTHLITTRAVEKTCPCGQLIYAGVAEGLPARVDVDALNRRQEVDALLEGRWTFALTRGRELVHRTPGRIRVGLSGISVHRQHRCESYIQPILLEATERIKG